MKGTYCLLINLGRNSAIKIGALGKTFFPKGNYVYVGSAMNSLEKRIQRHFRKKKKKHWHIDFLLSSKNAKLEKAFFKESNKKEECLTAKKIAEAGIPVKGFGCSDCKCKSHFFKVKNFSKPKGFKEFKVFG